MDVRHIGALFLLILAAEIAVSRKRAVTALLVGVAWVIIADMFIEPAVVQWFRTCLDALPSLERAWDIPCLSLRFRFVTIGWAR